jgi:hypothetical protein
MDEGISSYTGRVLPEQQFRYDKIYRLKKICKDWQVLTRENGFTYW